jgi:protein gp37
MSDLFHEDVPLEFIQEVFATMVKAPQHTYQVLTKQAERAAELSAALPCPKHIWLGVSVENADCVDRIDHLRGTEAAVKFLSLEPLLASLEGLNLKGIDWAIAGGESGPGARPMPIEWVRSIRDQCVAANVAFHFKQWAASTRSGRVGCSTGRHGTSYPHATPNHPSPLSIERRAALLLKPAPA